MLAVAVASGALAVLLLVLIRESLARASDVIDLARELNASSELPARVHLEHLVPTQRAAQLDALDRVT